ncbi:MAG: Calx-beta domain-containing protein, partial [Bacteroidota bacterium]
VRIPVALLLCTFFLLGLNPLAAQFTETFEDETTMATTFSGGGLDFTLTQNLAIAFFANGGANGAGDNRFIEGAGSNNLGNITVNTPNRAIQLNSVAVYLSQNGGNNTANGLLTFRGTLLDGGTIDAAVMITHPGTTDYAVVDFSGTPLAGQSLTSVQVILSAGFNYVALDNFSFTIINTSVTNVSINDVSLNEGDAGTTSFDFTVTRSSNATAFTVTFSTEDGNATAGQDYTEIASSTLNFAAGGALSQTFSVSVQGDEGAEPNESFFVNLSNATNGTFISDGQGLGTILDDDAICETFEDEAAAGLNTFAEGGVGFSLSNQLVTGFFDGGGGAGSDYYIESNITALPHSGNVGSFMVTTPNTGVILLQLDLWTSNDDNANTAEVGTIRLTGTPATGGSPIVIELSTLASAGSSNFTENISLAGTAFAGVTLSSVAIELLGNSNYLAIDNLCFEAVDLCPDVSMTTNNPSLCSNAGLLNDFTGGSPVPGTATGDSGGYSGPGVTDNGNGTYNFDTELAGVGVHTITYTYNNGSGCMESASDVITVVAAPTVILGAVGPFLTTDAPQILATGQPAGGVYSGPGVVNNGDGTYSFSPSQTGVGDFMLTYTFTDSNSGCLNAATTTVTVEMPQVLDGDVCDDAIDINSLFGQAVMMPQLSDVQDNTGYDAGNDPGFGYECFVDNPELNHTIWYTFTGDGARYTIRTVICDSMTNFTNNDSQFAMYTGDCSIPTAVACGEDEDFDNNLFNAFINFTTVPGETYRLMVDGYSDANYTAEGKFCLEVTLIDPVSTTDISASQVQIAPNPTRGWAHFTDVQPETVTVFNANGQIVGDFKPNGSSIDLSNLPAGLYWLKITTAEGISSARIVKE